MFDASGCEVQKEPSELLGRIVRVAGENDLVQLAGLLF
ncbi:hypothetical protein ABIB94_007967 [Bradyrhizobium sp. JR7.2]